MKTRELRNKIFLGSTTEEIEIELNNFIKESKMCPGNYVNSELYKLGSVYQLLFFYAELV